MTCKSEPMPGYMAQACTCGVVFYRHMRSRQRLCCPCRKTAIKSAEPTQPSNSAIKFQTADEINTYLGGDRIACLICGESFKTLGRHLVGAHKTTARSYKVLYGIPLGRALSVKEIREERKERAISRIASGSMRTSADPEHARLIASVPRSFVRPYHSPAAMAAINHGVKARASRKLIESVCSCGASAGMREEHIILKHACRILCKECKRERHIESERKWLAKIGYSSKSEYMRDLYLRNKEAIR